MNNTVLFLIIISVFFVFLGIAGWLIMHPPLPAPAVPLNHSVYVVTGRYFS